MDSTLYYRLFLKVRKAYRQMTVRLQERDARENGSKGIIPDGTAYWLEKAIEKARDCAECRECIEKCPYDLDIPALLKENIEFWEKLKKEHKSF